MTPEADRLATTNMRLVYAIAHAHVARLGGDFDELIGDGMIGLCEAAARFQADQEGLAFGTYAGRRVLA